MSGIKNVTVFGSGLMGAGIAELSLIRGFKVTLVDLKIDILRANAEGIRQRLLASAPGDDAAAKAKHVAGIFERLRLIVNPDEAVKTADLVIEAVVEKLDVKQQLFARLEAASPATYLFATNTSSLLLKDIFANVVDKTRCGGLHFFCPVATSKIVEVVAPDAAALSTVQRLKAFADEIRLKGIVCKDTPGFVVNRVLIPYLSESLGLVERGISTPKEVDEALCLALGMPIGPFRLMDYVGLDIVAGVREGWRNFDEYNVGSSKILENLLKEGKLGKKTGEGFYKHKI